MTDPEMIVQNYQDEIDRLNQLPKLKPWEQRRLRELDRRIYLIVLWHQTGVRCPCCKMVGFIHDHRATCAITGRQFHFDPFDAKNINLPRHPGNVAEYWKNRPKTFKPIVKGESTNGERSDAKRQRSLGFI